MTKSRRNRWPKRWQEEKTEGKRRPEMSNTRKEKKTKK